MSAPQPGASPGHGAHGGQPGVSGGGRHARPGRTGRGGGGRNGRNGRGGEQFMVPRSEFRYYYGRPIFKDPVC